MSYEGATTIIERLETVSKTVTESVNLIDLILDGECRRESLKNYKV